MSPERTLTKILLPSARVFLGIIVAALGVALLAGSASIALRGHPKLVAGYGATTAWLVTTGKMCGLVAATLILLQFALGAKLKTLDRVFGLPRLLFIHRSLGISAAVLASLHPLFMFAPESIEIGPFRLAIWPEVLGAVLLVGLWTGVCTGLWREFLRLRYEMWYLMHRLGMFSAVMLLTLHVLYVSDDLDRGWPMYALMVALGLYVALFVWVKGIKPTILKKPKFTVASVTPAGRDTYAVELTPKDGDVFSYAPGQFAFATFYSEALPVERHHWTISSTPTRPGSFIFTIKCSGDFTALIGRLRPGDTAIVDGPYGLFSHLAHVTDPNREIVMVAGGVGVTPMLSMLRYMADVNDARKTTLIWSNRTEADILCREELETIGARLPKCTIHHVLTDQKEFKGRTGRLNETMLEEILLESSRDAAVFVCGPPPMMDSICKALKNIGFKGRHIHTERFSI